MISAVRNMSMTTALPLAGPANQLGLKPNVEGWVLALTVEELEKDAHDARFAWHATFCKFLNIKDGYIPAFNMLTYL